MLVVGIPRMESVLTDDTNQFGVLEDIPGLMYCQKAEEVYVAVREFCKAGNVLYFAESLTGIYRKGVQMAAEVVKESLRDEVLEILEAQVVSVSSPEEFEDQLVEAAMSGLVGWETELDGNTVRFGVVGQTTHTMEFKGDSIYLDGVILRHTVVVGKGHALDAVVGERVLTPQELAGMIARRIAVAGPAELAGYGRAFGPDREERMNAHLAGMSRGFRETGVVGVVSADLEKVEKSRAGNVVNAAYMLREVGKTATQELLNKLPIGVDLMGLPEAREVLDTLVFMHQMGKELYVGQAAARAFRMKVKLNEERKLIVEAYGKSSKHWRVDAGAYCLNTEAGGYVDLNAVLGQFEESNDGSIYAPLAMMERELRGYLRESVKVTSDFRHMSEEARLKYTLAEVTVKVGDRIEPGDVVIRSGDKEVSWNSKADYGIVREVVEEFGNELVKKSHFEVRIDAWFEGDAKIRGFGKGLVCPAEAAGITYECKIGGHVDRTERLLVGVPGIVKDSAAAKEYILSQEPCEATVTTVHNAESFKAMVQKHMPDEAGPGYEQDDDPEVVLKRYPNGVVVTFDYRTCTISTFDPNAIAARIRVVIEAAPVGQSVGGSSLTMPQIGFLASYEAGNRWLNRFVLPGVKRRIRTLGYFKTVAAGIDPSAAAEEGETEDEPEIVISI